MNTQVAIIGAGLGGLNAGPLLVGAGVPCKVIASRERTGGRILSVGQGDRSDPFDAEPGPYDRGPAWIWPDAQPLVRRAVAEPGVATFVQPTDGGFPVERSRRETPQR